MSRAISRSTKRLRRRRLSWHGIAVVATLATASLATAADRVHPAPDPLPSPNAGHRLSVQAMAGPLFFPAGLGPDEESVRSVHTNLRLGWSLVPHDEDEHRWIDGLEILLEGGYARIYEGPGRVIAGSSLLLRYNGSSILGGLVPYVQAGAGVAYADLSRDRTQRITGQRFNFQIQIGAGLRYPLAGGWSLDTELLYFHISNAGLDRQNLGLNSLGGLIGFTRSFETF